MIFADPDDVPKAAVAVVAPVNVAKVCVNALTRKVL
jgi:hypothetical protein